MNQKIVPDTSNQTIEYEMDIEKMDRIKHKFISQLMSFRKLDNDYDDNNMVSKIEKIILKEIQEK